jgi:hypothetical protein
MDLKAAYAASSLIIDSQTLQFLPFKLCFHASTLPAASFLAASSLVAETLMVLIRLRLHPQVLQDILVFILSEFIFFAPFL